MAKEAVCVFPGQASQYVGMGKELYENYSCARSVFDRASEILKLDIKELCFNGPEDILMITENVQPAITATSIACMEALKEEGIKPIATAGHSLGEYAALYTAGALDLDTVITLVAVRGKAMQKAAENNPGFMLALIGADLESARRLCDVCSESGTICIANINSPMQIILSGSIPAVEQAANKAKEYGIRRAVALKVSGAWHSPLMNSAKESFAEAVKNADIKNAVVPVVANITANVEMEIEEIKRNLIEQVTGSVSWVASVQKLKSISKGVPFIEVGPGKVLTGIIGQIDKEIKMLNVENLESLAATLAF